MQSYRFFLVLSFFRTGMNPGAESHVQVGDTRAIEVRERRTNIHD